MKIIRRLKNRVLWYIFMYMSISCILRWSYFNGDFICHSFPRQNIIIVFHSLIVLKIHFIHKNLCTNLFGCSTLHCLWKWTGFPYKISCEYFVQFYTVKCDEFEAIIRLQAKGLKQKFYVAYFISTLISLLIS